MPTFQYQVKDRSGKTSRGQMDAASMREVAVKLRDDGQYITNLQAVKVIQTRGSSSSSSSNSTSTKKSGGKVKLKDLMVFTRQFAVMIRAGVNLVNCLSLLSKQTESKYLAEVVGDIRRAVEGGETLHVALARFPKVFPPIYIHLVEAGEAGGQLESVLERVCEHLEREFELKKKVTGAMVYPAVIITVAVIVVLILLIFVIPQFLDVFRDAGRELPLMTRILISVTDFLKNFWYLVIGGLVGGVVGFRAYRNTPDGRRVTDRFFYRMKIIGPVIQKVASARFCRTLATLLESGVMITNSLELVERAVGNTVIAEAIASGRQNITKGSGLAQPLMETGVFPSMVTQMIAVGEETGELGQLLNQIADFYEKEASYAVESLTSLIEPAIIVVLGGIVAVIVSAIMIPMFELSSGAAIK